MEKYSFAIWISALFLPAVGFFAYKITVLKKTRFVLDCVTLFTAFLFDLLAISFKTDFIDLLLFFTVITILMKFAWGALNIRIKVFKYTVLAAGLVVFVVQFRFWIPEKPEIVFAKRFPVTVESYSDKNGYRIKEVNYLKNDDIYRSFSLYKDGSLAVLEKKLDTYIVKEGYKKANFSFKLDVNGTVTLIGDTDTLWSLKEVH